MKRIGGGGGKGKEEIVVETENLVSVLDVGGEGKPAGVMLRSRYFEINSMGHVLAETIRWSGLLGFWVLGRCWGVEYGV